MDLLPVISIEQVSSPNTFENGWSPENYEKEFSGPVTLREAFEHSINVVGVKLLDQVGIKKVINYSRKAE
ncbi:unnamed protein product [marine sediment metagenome]|uniref:Uncharacterized protein n=1 Tax=marine sediment metagenome TaxID=412755 RepID=X0YXL2_9ZZZZ